MDNLHPIKNYSLLATSSARKIALDIAETGLRAISTEEIIKQNLKLDGNVLKVKNHFFDLGKFRKVCVIGFGKASCDAILAINNILQSRISAGIAIDIRTVYCDNPNIKIYKGSHPKPTADNYLATQEILDLSKQTSKDTFIICIVSGGGSALLCADEKECSVSNLIYDQFLKTGGTITQLNTLRKHTSILKGGGLAKLFYPATIVGLIFSDIPGGEVENVASGPTYLDQTTVFDVKKMIAKYNLKALETFTYSETPKEGKYFENVTNILLVSNHQAIEAMAERAKKLNFTCQILSESVGDQISLVASIFNSNLKPNQIRLGGGEPLVKAYPGKFGKGGRNTQLVLESIPYLLKNQVFISIASDGVDNSDAAGAIADYESLKKINSSGLNLEEQKNALDSYPVFEKIGDLIKTGPTGANVADLMISLRM